MDPVAWGNGLLLHGVAFHDLIFLDTIRTHGTVLQFWGAVLLIFEQKWFSSPMTNTWHRVLLCQPDRETDLQVMGVLYPVISSKIDGLTQ